MEYEPLRFPRSFGWPIMKAMRRGMAELRTWASLYGLRGHREPGSGNAFVASLSATTSWHERSTSASTSWHGASLSAATPRHRVGLSATAPLQNGACPSAMGKPALRGPLVTPWPRGSRVEERPSTSSLACVGNINQGQLKQSPTTKSRTRSVVRSGRWCHAFWECRLLAGCLRSSCVLF